MQNHILDYAGPRKRDDEQSKARWTDGGIISCLCAAFSLALVMAAFQLDFSRFLFLPVILNLVGFFIGLGGFIDGGRDMGWSVLGAFINGFCAPVCLLAPLLD